MAAPRMAGDRAGFTAAIWQQMSGLVGNDFGDAIRFEANFAEEACSETDKMGAMNAIARDCWMQYR